jgi:hypothetical protein
MVAAISCLAGDVGAAGGATPSSLASACATIQTVHVACAAVATAVGSGALDVGSAIASTPTRIAGARASIVGIGVVGVAMVAAVATMATRRRRRIPAATRAALAGQSLVQLGGAGSVLCALHESTVSSLHILVLVMSSKQCTQLLAHLFCDIRICSNAGPWLDAIKQLSLEVLAQCTFIFCIALLCELIEHVFEGGFHIVFGFGEDAQVAETVACGTLVRLELQE